jgi:hypothetical protein
MDLINNMTVGQLTIDAALIIAGLATLIQIAPIKINPWSALAKAIGRAINKEVIEKVDKLEHDVGVINDKVGESGAKTARARILRFGDEIIHGVRHSKEHFDDILDDITDYENYCKDHPNFKNGKTGLTSNLIKETYQKCLKEHDFI